MKIYLLSVTLLILSISHTQAQSIAPDWQLNTQDGAAISLSQYQGKPIILHFWATWCPYCKKLQPELVRLQKKYQTTGVKIVSISFNEDEGAMPQDEIHSRGYDFITAVNGDSIAKLYGVKGTPTTFFINRSGEIIFKSTSSDISDPRLDLALQAITQ
ncbi:MAG: cytochrome c biogenesis protein CcmG/thiol:disulfide interchange protein DsbE [Alteromonadaceae bacterium]|jgi:cytochrome c biogenesis protein CcmG/thiol:disulfide interchange protein DsbE